MKTLELALVKPRYWPTAWHLAWTDAKQPAPNPFDKGGLASCWSTATHRTVEQGVGALLAWLQIKGDFDPHLPLEALVDQARIRAFLDAYSPGRAEATVATTVRGIAYYLRATLPPMGLPWLTKLAHRMSSSAIPERPKPPRMASVPELITLGFRLMEAGLDKLARGQISGAQVYRDGLMIACLAARPLRLRNLCALRVGHSVHRTQTGYRVEFSGSQTKKGIAIEFVYPQWLIEPLDIYLEEVRPLLLSRAQGDQGDAGWLWIGRRGRPLPPTNVTTTITNTTTRYLGRGVSPHLFRDCAATGIALHDPEHVGITKDILGHATAASGERFYNQASSFKALSGWERVLVGLLED
jgi:integrase